MGEGDPSLRKNDRKAEVTLRGLRFTTHSSIPNELRGTTVPWLRLQFFTQNGFTTAHCFHDDGQPMRIGKRYLAPDLAMSDGPTARRVQARARRNALADGSLDLTVVDTEFRSRRIIAALAPILVASVLAMMIWARVGPQGRTWSGFLAWLAANWGMASMFLFAFGTPLLLVCMVLRSMACANVRSIRLTAEGFCCEVHRLGMIQARWDQVSRIRNRIGHEIRLSDGRTLRVIAGRAGFILNDRMGRLHGPPPKRALRRLLVLVLGVFQVGGLVAAYLSLSGAAVFPFGPVRAYLTVAFGYPAMFALMGLVPWSFVRVAKWVSRRSRKRARQVRQGRIAA